MARKTTSRLSAALKRVKLTVEINAAQHMVLRRLSVRYRCTPEQLLPALSLAWLDMQGGAGAEMQDSGLLSALLKYTDAGETPSGCYCESLPGQLDPEAPESFRAKAMKRTHGDNAAALLFAQGKITEAQYFRLVGCE